MMNTIANHNNWLYASYTYQQEREWKALRERLREEYVKSSKPL